MAKWDPGELDLLPLLHMCAHGVRSPWKSCPGGLCTRLPMAW